MTVSPPSLDAAVAQAARRLAARTGPGPVRTILSETSFSGIDEGTEVAR